VVVLDALTLPEIKTRLMAQALNQIVGEASALILIPEKNEDYQRVVRSANNLPDTKTILVNYLNIRDLLGFDRLVFPLSVLERLEAMLA
jgi:large subunit ribosomal protein L4